MSPASSAEEPGERERDGKRERERGESEARGSKRANEKRDTTEGARGESERAGDISETEYAVRQKRETIMQRETGEMRKWVHRGGRERFRHTIYCGLVVSF